MYKGLSPSLMALLPNWAVYFCSYDLLKRSLSKDKRGRPAPPSLAVQVRGVGEVWEEVGEGGVERWAGEGLVKGEGERGRRVHPDCDQRSRILIPAPRSPPSSQVLAATGAGLSTLIVTNPLFVVKTRMQTQDLLSVKALVRVCVHVSRSLHLWRPI
jgi:solute carrier family 25 folate transporter 32